MNELSTKILFLAAIAFMLANIIYALFCPRLIKETSAYRDFSEQKRSGIELAATIDDLGKRGLINNDVSIQWLNWFNARQVMVHQQGGSYSYDKEDRAFTDAYAVAVEALGWSNKVARVAATLFYGFGFLTLAYIMWQNTCFVIEHW